MKYKEFYARKAELDIILGDANMLVHAWIDRKSIGQKLEDCSHRKLWLAARDEKHALWDVYLATPVEERHS